MDGGLNEESRMKRVLGDSATGAVGSCGCVLEGWTVRNIRNFDSEFWKPFIADPRSLTRVRRDARLDAIAAAIVFPII